MADIQNYEIDIDLKQNLLITVACKQLDNLNLVFNIWNDGQVANLSDYTCRLKALKSDQIPLVQDTNIEIKNNVVKIKCNEQLTTTSSVVKAELQFINKTTKEKKSSFNIEIDVIKSALEVNRSISKATYDLLQELEYNLDKVEDLEFNFNEADKLNKEIKNTTTPNANNINNTLVKNIDTANTSNKNLVDSTNTANTAKQAVDSSVVQANTSKQALDTSKTNADNTKKEVDNSIKIADEKIEIIKQIDPENIVQKVNTLENKVLKNELTPIETDSVLTKLDNCIGEYVHNMQIRGKTFQNLIGSCKNDIFSLTTPGATNVKKLDASLLKSNTQYSFVLNLGNVSNGTSTIHLSVHYKDGTHEFKIFSSIVNDIANKITVKVFTFNKEIDRMSLEINTGNQSNVVVNFNSLMVLEGEPKEIPPYFEGIKSVGELEGNKISILTKGKNLFNINNIDKNDSSIESKKINDREFYVQLKKSDYKYANTSQLIYLKAGVTYCFKYDAEVIEGSSNFIRIAIKDTHNRNISYSGDNPPSNVNRFTVPRNDIYVVYIYVSGDAPSICKVVFKDLQIEEGTTVSQYVSGKEDKTEILLPNEPLRGLPDGTADVVDFDKNELTRNIFKLILNGNENYIMDGGQGNDTTVLFTSTLVNRGMNTPPICNKFVGQENGEVYAKISIQEAISFSEGGVVRLRVAKSRLETPDVVGLKKLLKTWSDAGTPLEVFYQLATPVKEKLNIKDTLQTFQDGYIQLSNAITPCTQLEYSTNIPSIVTRLVENQDRLIDRINRLEDLIITKIATNK